MIAVATIAAGGALLASQQDDQSAWARDLDCSSAPRPSMMNVEAVQRRYAERGVQIVGAAARHDRAELERFVAPNSRFSIWRGDSVVGRERGIAGALEFVSRLRARSYQIAWAFGGPVSSDPCGTQEAEVIFLDSDQQSYRTRFRFENGRLTDVSAVQGGYSAGEVASYGR